MIDANVFEPNNGDLSNAGSAAFIEHSTNAGWNAMLVHKPFRRGLDERCFSKGQT